MWKWCLMLCVPVIAISAAALGEVKTLTVAQDGSGDFETVQAAVDAVPADNASLVVIDIKPGTYKQRIMVPENKRLVTLHGVDSDPAKTVLTWDWNAKHVDSGKEVGTRGSFSVQAGAPDFVAENVTFENTAGDTGQALALSAVNDRQVYRNCRLLGWQDTLYANGGRQYYDHCYIAGRVDFIFGNAVAVFDHCEIHSKNGGHVTAASTDQNVPWGYVFLDCVLTGDAIPYVPIVPTTMPIKVTPKADLGRPWRPYASVTYVRCEMADHIKPEGWQNWNKTENYKTARYAEYRCTGPGADRSKRVEWAKELSAEEGEKLTIDFVLGGTDHWDPKAVKP